MNELAPQDQATEIYGIGGMPQSFNNKYLMAEKLAKSGLMPNGLSTPEKVLVALQYGYELQLSPMVAVNNIAVINGKPSISTDLMHAIVKRSPEYAGCEWVKMTDTEAMVKVKRRTANYTEEVIGSFTIEEAKKAGLIRDKSPWVTYPKRMLKHRALKFALQDAFPDILAGFQEPDEAREIAELQNKTITNEIPESVSAGEQEKTVIGEPINPAILAAFEEVNTANVEDMSFPEAN